MIALGCIYTEQTIEFEDLDDVGNLLSFTLCEPSNCKKFDPMIQVKEYEFKSPIFQGSMGPTYMCEQYGATLLTDTEIRIFDGQDKLKKLVLISNVYGKR